MCTTTLMEPVVAHNTDLLMMLVGQAAEGGSKMGVGVTQMRGTTQWRFVVFLCPLPFHQARPSLAR